MWYLSTSRRRRQMGPSRPPSRFVHLHLEELEPRAVPAMTGISFFPGPQPTDFNNVFTVTPSPVNSQGVFNFPSTEAMGSALLTYGTQSVPGFASLYPVANSFYTLGGLGFGFEPHLYSGVAPTLAPYLLYSSYYMTSSLELNPVFVPTLGPLGLPLSSPAPLPILNPAQYQLMYIINPFKNNTDTTSLINQIYLNNWHRDVGGAGNNLLLGPAAPVNEGVAPTEENLLEYIRVLGDARPVHPAAEKAQPALDKPTPSRSEQETPPAAPARPTPVSEDTDIPVQQPAAAATVAFWTVKTPDEMGWDTTFDHGDLPAPVIDSWSPVVDALAVATVSDGGDGGEGDDPDA